MDRGKISEQGNVSDLARSLEQAQARAFASVL
jgi:hypothetical protein